MTQKKMCAKCASENVIPGIKYAQCLNCGHTVKHNQLKVKDEQFMFASEFFYAKQTMI